MVPIRQPEVTLPTEIVLPKPVERDLQARRDPELISRGQQVEQRTPQRRQNRGTKGDVLRVGLPSGQERQPIHHRLLGETDQGPSFSTSDRV